MLWPNMARQERHRGTWREGIITLILIDQVLVRCRVLDIAILRRLLDYRKQAGIEMGKLDEQVACMPSQAGGGWLGEVHVAQLSVHY